MEDFNTIIANKSAGEIIDFIKSTPKSTPPWGDLVKDYDPKLHKIVNDNQTRQDKVHEDGTVDKAARNYIGLEKLLVRRFTDFTFAIPVKRVYSGNETEVGKQIYAAIERIYTTNHINSLNIERAIAYYASCETFTIWYTKEEANNLYGFPCSWKLRCKSFSPMDDVKIFPLFDELDDLIALAFEYVKRIDDKNFTTYFECYTKYAHYKWRMENSNVWEEVSEPTKISIKKIPASYIQREAPVFDGLTVLREDLEYTVSRNSDVVAYNSSPILKVAGQIKGEERKGESKRVYRVMEGGDVSYVSWQQAIDALKYHIDTLVKLFFMQSQMPDISFENLKSLGNIGYDSRKTLLADAHLRIGEEKGPWLEFLEREASVIKAFLKEMKTEWRDEIDKVHIEHIITPFVQEDEKSEIEKWMMACGNEPILSQLEAIKKAGVSDNPEATLKAINEQAASNNSHMDELFSNE